jgi:hypothetical protein
MGDEMTSVQSQQATRLTTGPLPLSEAKAQADRVESLLANHQRDGGKDMTVREVCVAYESVYGHAMFPNHAEGRLGNLEAARRELCDRENKRPCRVTGVTVKVYRVVEKQVELI